MNLKSIFGGVPIGKDTSGNVKPSVKGLAVRVSDDRFVVKDGDNLLDVDGFAIDGGEKYVYRLPVKPDQVKPGDLLITSENPFRALFVKTVNGRGRMRGLDPWTGMEVDYIGSQNLFGTQFLVKAISLIDGFGGGGLRQGGPGDNLLPLLALSGGISGLSGGAEAAAGEDGLTTLLLVQSLGGQAIDINKLLPFFLLKGSKGESLETLFLLQSLGLDLGNLGGGQQAKQQAQQGAQARQPVQRVAQVKKPAQPSKKTR